MNIIAEKRKFEDGDFRIKFKLIVGEMGLIACRFYWPELSSKDSSLHLSIQFYSFLIHTTQGYISFVFCIFILFSSGFYKWDFN